MNEEQTKIESMADLEAHFDDANPWNLIMKYKDEQTILPVKVEGVVNGGVVTTVEGIRGFIPASRLDLSYVENTEEYLLKDIEVRVLEADQAENRLVLSAREILREKEAEKKAQILASVQPGQVMKGVVESMPAYGAFIRLDNGCSGLVHISQISHNRIRTPEDVLQIGQDVDVKIIGIKDGKISLSIKALLPDEEAEEPVEEVEIPKAEDIGTSLADLMSKFHL